MRLLLQISLLAFVAYQACNATSFAHLHASRMMKIIKAAIKTRDVTTLMFITHKNMTYSMCGFVGDHDNFQSFMENQLENMITAKTHLFGDEAQTIEENGRIFIKFSFTMETTYRDRDRIDGLVTIIAIQDEQNPNHFEIMNIHEKCRILNSRHRLYRLFTYTDLYDY
ncbi:unnamed protein product [Caenorhabditis bovis]|uniref:DUF38 domain-containing protein n=1 Tax=Caenorhabditis bovis TaxID=2654633 RepID=A0A8S1FBW9_9PELO|nr:unnamed protein product [Caenorhabditis bovis]